jgi:hypothetical protein
MGHVWGTIPYARLFAFFELEAAMKKLRNFLRWTSVLLLITSGIAGNGWGDESSTSPEHKGNTGWTGGGQNHNNRSGGSSTVTSPTGQGAAVKSPKDDAAASTQPPMATGSDLNGTPQRFPPNQTPE